MITTKNPLVEVLGLGQSIWYDNIRRSLIASGEPERLFRDSVDGVLDGGTRRVVVDLTRSHLADESVAAAAPEAYHKARSRGADMRFVVMPGRAGGFYHMAGLELAIPTYTRLGGAIDF